MELEADREAKNSVFVRRDKDQRIGVANERKVGRPEIAGCRICIRQKNWMLVVDKINRLPLRPTIRSLAMCIRYEYA